MTKLAKILIAGTALATLAMPVAYAGGSTSDNGGAQVVNGQVNLGNVWSQLNVDLANVQGDVTEVSTSVGNTVQIYTMTDSQVTNNQVAKGAIGTKLNANVVNVGGSVDLEANTVCNGASISTDPNVTKVSSSQVCASTDPSSALNATVQNVGGNVNIAGATIGNQMEVDTNAASFPVNNYQENDGGLYSTVNASVSNVKGSVTTSATAVGNSAQIVQVSTGH